MPAKITLPNIQAPIRMLAPRLDYKEQKRPCTEMPIRIKSLAQTEYHGRAKSTNTYTKTRVNQFQHGHYQRSFLRKPDRHRWTWSLGSGTIDARVFCLNPAIAVGPEQDMHISNAARQGRDAAGIVQNALHMRKRNKSARKASPREFPTGQGCQRTSPELLVLHAVWQRRDAAEIVPCLFHARRWGESAYTTRTEPGHTCLQCRKSKSNCGRDRPMCFSCRMLRRQCVYDIYIPFQ